jgi:3-oxoadipate enol-lactonase
MRVVAFDLLGQGNSDKPALFIDQDELVEMTDAIVKATAGGPVILAGISFGGLIALRYAIEHPDSICGLVAMSTFAELSPQLQLIGNALRMGLILGGVGYLQDLLLPMNVSDDWLRPHLDNLDAVKRAGWLANDLYALQNLMESFLDFKPLTKDLHRIRAPTLILNGEFDFLTPRALHEQMRLGIENSALVIIPRGYHAFTLERPELTAALLCNFADEAIAGKFKGGRKVLVAADDDSGSLEPFPAGYDHLRAIPAKKR